MTPLTVIGLAVLAWSGLCLLGAVFLKWVTKTPQIPKVLRRTSVTSKIGAGTRKKKGSFTIRKNSAKAISTRRKR